jgi:hypothetical protein
LVTDRRPPKKSESIEIRLSLEAKAAFMQRCSDEGVTASEAIRAMIDNRTAARAQVSALAPRWRVGLAIAAGIALGAGAAAPALAHANQTSRTAFERLDRNHDGVISYDEFRNR